MSVSGLSSSSLRSAGLASGLDTESIVKQMSALSKSRINSQQQKLDKLQWKQASYRDVIKKVSAFKDTYFNTLKPTTNMGSNSLFGARAATSTSSLLKVSAASNATEETYNISEVVSKASAASIEGAATPITGKINLDFASAVSGTNYTVKFTLDGSAKEITFTGGADAATTQTNFLAAVNAGFASSTASFSMSNGSLVATDATYTTLVHTYGISATTTPSSGVPSELTAIGLTGSVSSKTSLSKQLGELAFATPLEGNGFKFEINGKSFSFDKNTTISNVIDTVNNSDAGVKLSFDTLAGKFSLQTIESGVGSTLTLKQTSGNLLTSMFGSDKIAAASAVSSASLMSNGIEGNTPADGDGFGFEGGVSGTITDLLNKKLSVTVNGTTKEIGLWTYNSSGVKNDFTKSSIVLYQLNSELTKNFGSTAPQFSYDSTAQSFTLTTGTAGDVVSIDSVTDTSGGSAALLAALGFDNTNNTNEITTASKLFPGMEGTGISGQIDFGSGNIVNLDENSTIGDLVTGSGGNISFENGRLTLRGVDYYSPNTSDTGRTCLSSIFGEGYNYPGVPPTDLVTTYSDTGENALIKVNGSLISNSSNNITVNGTSFDISALSVGTQTDVSVTTAKSNTNAIDSVKKFVEDYNALIDNLNSEIKTAYDSDYPPLTDEQREEMSDKEIEAWEEKAKVGLLYQDQTIGKFLTSLRTAVNTRSSSGFGLTDMGITTSNNYLEYGKLEVNETKLAEAFNTNPDKIQALFTTVDTGLAAKVSSVIDSAAKTTGAAKGSLVLLAGAEKTASDTDNIISKQLQSYKDLIETLQEKYEDEQERYWSKFTSLETAMSSYNSQSEWLTSQFASS